jgi:hypothetical protein
VSIPIPILISIKISASVANSLKLMPALVCLAAVLSVSSELSFKVLLGFVNLFFAILARVRLQGSDTAKQATAQHQSKQRSLS